MITREFGKTGIEVSQLGYGAMGIRGPRTWGVRVVSDDVAEKILHTVLDAGISFIDTAPDYGISEERIGRFLSSRREEYYLATKCGCDYIQHENHLEVAHTWSREVVQRNIDNSLRRLRTDHLDLLQFHGGDAATLKQQGLIDLLADYRSQGIVRLIGASSSLPELPALIDLGVFDTFQIPYSCLAPKHHTLIHDAAATGAGIILRGGIAQGGPQAEIQRPLLNEVWTGARLEEILPDDMTAAQMILRYTLSHTACHTTIVGTCNPEHLAENIAAATAGPLASELVGEITTRVTEWHQRQGE
ncbi:MAG TPA: aldo/keto reductase [Planctomycetaceae bacterium]|nr:aldo/keto reductase [Planctomycetaceae bacterium]